MSAQGYYNLLRRHVELEVLPFCTANEIGFLPYRPLADGWLTGKYMSEGSAPATRDRVEVLRNDERNRERLAELTRFAAERGRSMLDLAFAWLLAHPAVSSVIAGVSSVEQAEANAAAADWEMSLEERDAVDAIVAWDGTGRRSRGARWAFDDGAPLEARSARPTSPEPCEPRWLRGLLGSGSCRWVERAVGHRGC